ncbi:hypothetical protein C8J57DRAFT_1230216 [Mycena rebaudengoi]|nr:hypothetical protein C8J57DRAFT_1230216 [Mycena rebaudengoi]
MRVGGTCGVATRAHAESRPTCAHAGRAMLAHADRKLPCELEYKSTTLANWLANNAPLRLTAWCYIWMDLRGWEGGGFMAVKSADGGISDHPTSGCMWASNRPGGEGQQ